MPSHAQPREASVFVESTLAEVQSDWGSNGTPIFVIEPDVSGVDQVNLDNENIQPRRTAVKRYIRGLKSGSTLSTSIYMHAAGASAAEAAAAAATIQTTIMRAAIGGRDLGYAIGLAGGSASAPELDADPGYVAGDWVFAYDTSAGTGRFARIESIAAGPPVVATLLEDLAFTPDAGGADVLHAVIDMFVLEAALNDHDNADHITLGWKVQGEGSEDVYELRGCKPTLGDLAITAGEPVALPLAHKAVTWASTPSATTFGASSGLAPNVPGTGSSCSIRIATFGSPMAEIDVRGTLTFKPAIDHDQVMGPNGVEGVHGYVATGVGEAEVELIVEYDNAYDTDWDAETIKHMIVQIGNTPASAWGLYFPALEYKEKPKRVDEGGVTSHRIVFRCMEDTASVVGLTGTNISKRRSPFHLLIAA